MCLHRVIETLRSPGLTRGSNFSLNLGFLPGFCRQYDTICSKPYLGNIKRPQLKHGVECYGWLTKCELVAGATYCDTVHIAIRRLFGGSHLRQLSMNIWSISWGNSSLFLFLSENHPKSFMLVEQSSHVPDDARSVMNSMCMNKWPLHQPALSKDRCVWQVSFLVHETADKHFWRRVESSSAKPLRNWYYSVTHVLCRPRQIIAGWISSY